ncbi:dephospho-CoA kinase [Candidatus Gastranaerophilus sp. (ex Termes propinquus)]|nr:dephospho-CoA kinase [Candidatus Gastranaerophilus sp. (ex Termes propinquus)]
MATLICDKIQKPNFNTRTGREFLAFYLSMKFKQIIARDKNTFFLATKENFLENFLKKIVNEPQNSIVVGIFGDDNNIFCEKLTKIIREQDLPVLVAKDFSALLSDEKIIIIKCEDSAAYKECDAFFHIKIFIKGGKTRDTKGICEITADGKCSEKHLGQILNNIKTITSDFYSSAGH